MTLILHYAPDNASLIVRLALEELGVPYRKALVDRARRAQEGADFRVLNPNGLIPVLETPHGAIFETGAILLWLADRQPGTLAPAPHDRAEGGAEQGTRGDFLKWFFFISNTLHPALRMTFYPEKFCPGHASALRHHMQAEILRHLATLDAAAVGPWFGGDALSLSDLYLAPLLRWCALYPENHTSWFDLGRTPALAAICARIEARGAAQRAALAEGLGDAPFTRPHPACPPEGSAT